ncbi:MAG: D-alanyl-D-alanine carboxypeptidase [Clostridia bacterium]|nr:D-alanyl-D-alanine carboxypeptidase [Clostridia bacterium]
MPTSAAVIIIDTESGETAAELMALKAPSALSEEVTVPTITTGSALEVGGKSAVLMDLSSGTVLYEKNAHEKLPIASVTKIMTLLLVMEAIDGEIISFDDPVTCSPVAASMGGSQIWLEPGEIMTVHELVKAAAVVSANDACAALAEHVAGSVEEFVQRMNTRAAELGMNDTHFLDCSGLNDEAYSCAYDVAVMSRELMKHSAIKQYTTIWMDTLRDGKSQLVNTNKLIRFYEGATGLKTGTTSAAGHNLAATAERNGFGLAAVILGCSTTDERFGGARKLLDYGFANYSLYTPQIAETELQPVPVLHGVQEQVNTVLDEPQPILVKKGQEKQIERRIEFAEDVEAPVEQGQVVGQVVFTLEGEELACYPIRTAEAVGRMNFGTSLLHLLVALCN